LPTFHRCVRELRPIEGMASQNNRFAGATGTAPNTFPKQIFSANLPTNINLSQVAVRFDLVANGSTSGVAQVNVYAVWIEIEEVI
jgi:hypothetical protein